MHITDSVYLNGADGVRSYDVDTICKLHSYVLGVCSYNL